MSTIQRDDDPTVLEEYEDRRRVRSVDHVVLDSPDDITKIQAGDILYTTWGRSDEFKRKRTIQQISSTLSSQPGIHVLVYDWMNGTQGTLHLSLIESWLDTYDQCRIEGFRRRIHSQVRGFDYDEEYER